MNSLKRVRYLAGRVGRACGLVFVPSAADTYLVSYPRSGNTWLRAAIAEMMFGDAGDRWGDIHYRVPSVQLHVPVWKLKRSPFHVVKSHEFRMIRSRSAGYGRVLYLIRDPRDVALSHFTFRRQQGKCGSDFDAFLNDWLNGRIWPGSWGVHVNSWTADRPPSEMDKTLILKYEEVHESPGRCFLAVARFLGLDLGQREIDSVVEKTSVTRMRAKENANKEQPIGFRSVREGGVAKWKSLMTEQQSARVFASFRREMERFGYQT